MHCDLSRGADETTARPGALACGAVTLASGDDAEPEAKAAVVRIASQTIWYGTAITKASDVPRLGGCIFIMDSIVRWDMYLIESGGKFTTLPNAGRPVERSEDRPEAGTSTTRAATKFPAGTHMHCPKGHFFGLDEPRWAQARLPTEKSTRLCFLIP